MLRNDGSGTDPRRHHKKTCWDGVKEDMKRFGLSRKDAQSRRKLRRKIGGGIQQTRVKPTCVFSIDNYCISSSYEKCQTSGCILLVVYNGLVYFLVLITCGLQQEEYTSTDVGCV